MKHCPNPDCPDLHRYGFRGEYFDHVESCPKCGERLSEGAAPPAETRSRWLDLVPVSSPRDVSVAQVERAALESAGIPAFIENDNIVGLQWTLSQAVGGVRVLVPRDRAVEAQELLSTDASIALRDTTEMLLPPAPDETCPRCGAENVRPARIPRRVRTASLLVGIPITFSRDRLTCSHCGHRWSAQSGGA